MNEITTSHELHKTIRYELFTSVNNELFNQIKAFQLKEQGKFPTLDIELADKINNLNSQLKLASITRTIEEIQKHCPESYFVVIAWKGNEVIGVRSVGLNLTKADRHNNHVMFGHIAVASEYMGKGVSNELIMLSNEKLQSMGIESYVASVWGPSKKMYEKLNLIQEVIETNGDKSLIRVRTRA